MNCARFNYRCSGRLSRSAGRLPVLVCAILAAGSARLTASSLEGDEALSERADMAIRGGVDFLWSQQRRGRWPSAKFDYLFPNGMTALTAYTLKEAHAPGSDHRLQLAVRRLLDRSRTTTVFARSFTLLLWCSLDPEDYWRQIDEDISFLAAQQDKRGAWGFGLQPGERRDKRPRDNSNSQLALLALAKASGVGARVSGNVWRRGEQSWLGQQNIDGGWGYRVHGEESAGGVSQSYGTMTAAGVASLRLIYDRLYLEAELPFSGKFKANCGLDIEKTRPIRRAIRRGGEWIDANFSVDRVPKLPADTTAEFIETYPTYYLHCLARFGNLSGKRLIGSEPWHRRLAEYLVSTQQSDGSWGSLQETCFAVLALVESRTPVLVNKLRFGAPTDWNNDPRDAANLTGWFSERLGRRVTWQTVDLDDEPEAIEEAPVLLITGHEAPALSEAARSALRDHVWSGGTILGVACCSKQTFADGFLKMMSEIFPMFEEAPLSDDHPLWTMVSRVEPGADVIGLSDKCRTPILLSTSGACCAWHQNAAEDHGRLFDIGVNILAYASYDTPLPSRLATSLATAPRPAFRSIQVARLKHGGDWWTGMDGLKALSRRLTSRMGIRIDDKPAIMPIDARNSGARVMWLASHTFEPPSAAGRIELKSYLAAGGTLMASACCGDPAFDETFQAWAMELYEADRWVRIPAEDPLMTGAFAPALASSLHGLSYRGSPDGGEPARLDWPILYGIKHRDRWVVIYSPYDISCGLGRHPCVACVGYVPLDTDTIATNVLLYALTGAGGRDKATTPGSE